MWILKLPLVSEALSSNHDFSLPLVSHDTHLLFKTAQNKSRISYITSLHSFVLPPSFIFSMLIWFVFFWLLLLLLLLFRVDFAKQYVFLDKVLHNKKLHLLLFNVWMRLFHAAFPLFRQVKLVWSPSTCGQELARKHKPPLTGQECYQGPYTLPCVKEGKISDLKCFSSSCLLHHFVYPPQWTVRPGMGVLSGMVSSIWLFHQW